MPKKPASKSTSLFEIRFKNLDHDVIVLKGSEHTAASTFVTGKIVLSVTEPISVKKISLRLYGTLRLRYNLNTPRPVRFEKKLFENNWDSSEFAKYLNNIYHNSSGSGDRMVPSKVTNPLQMGKTPHLKGSTTSLKNLGHSLRSMSSTSLSSVATSAGSSSTNLASKGTHVLVSGNYEIPFQAILPGDMPESVEGLPGGSVVYKLEATIDRGKFHNPLVTKKHTRVVRTMTTDSVELSETMAVDNTWPKKVEYSLSVPSRAIAIGSGTPVSMMLVPLLKGLQLGEIKITLVEMYSLVGYIPPPYTYERVVEEKILPAPSPDDPDFQMDKWEITTFFKIPPNLSKCTQDCDISIHMKVRHKMKFVICLKNPDGHTSELRASLPVQLFISPFVSVRAKYDDEDRDSDAASVEDDEEVLFTTDLSSANFSPTEGSESGELRSNPHSVSSFTGLVAPPVYEQHVYDQLWSDVSPVESPSGSGTQTPRSLYGAARPGAGGDMSQFSMSAIDTAKLSENLRQLSIQRQLQEGADSRHSTPGRATFNLDGDNEAGDYFSRSPRPGLSRNGSSALFALNSPGPVSPEHLSRVHSDVNVKLGDSDRMAKVPSYSEAMKSNVEDHLSPRYQPPLPGSQIDLAEVNRRYEENMSKSPQKTHPLSHQRNRSFLSRGPSTFSLRGSNGSSPSNSRDQSYNNLLNMSGSEPQRSRSRGTGHATFSMAE